MYAIPSKAALVGTHCLRCVHKQYIIKSNKMLEVDNISHSMFAGYMV